MLDEAKAADLATLRDKADDNMLYVSIRKGGSLVASLLI